MYYPLYGVCLSLPDIIPCVLHECLILHSLSLPPFQLLKKLCAMGQNVQGQTDTTAKRAPREHSPVAPAGGEENMSSDSENEEERLEEQSPTSDLEDRKSVV